MGNKGSKISKEDFKKLQSCSHFDHEELKALHGQFTKDNPLGFVNKEEFSELMNQTGITDEFMKDLMFKTFDLNSDGKIDAKEFILGMSILTRGTAEEKLEFAFKMYDLNSDGFISREEMTQIVQSLHRMLGMIIIAGTDEELEPDAVVDLMFREMDENKDGRISLEEYKKGAHKCLIQGLTLI